MVDVADDGSRSFDGNHTMSGAHFFDVPECVYQQGSSHVGQRKKKGKKYTHTHILTGESLEAARNSKTIICGSVLGSHFEVVIFGSL